MPLGKKNKAGVANTLQEYHLMLYFLIFFYSLPL
jgi:hypothetical protein